MAILDKYGRYDLTLLLTEKKMHVYRLLKTENRPEIQLLGVKYQKKVVGKVRCIYRGVVVAVVKYIMYCRSFLPKLRRGAHVIFFAIWHDARQQKKYKK